MLHELRLAFRSLLKQPGLTLVAVVTIALGSGANSAIFSVVDAVMLKPLPFSDADRVVLINEQTPQFPLLSLSRENYQDVCAQARSFSACGAFRTATFNLSDRTEPRRIPGKQITANLLSLLGITPVVGRTFTDPEDARGGEHVVMLSYALWQTSFGGRASVIGERLLLDGTPYTVIGVLPAGFRLFQVADVVLPIGPFLAVQPPDRNWHPGIQPIARLKDGVSVREANAEIAGIAARLEKAYPLTNNKTAMLVTRAQELMIQGVRTALLVLLGAVASVLLIACINVAGLLLARGLARRRDIALRVALGASRTRVVGHVIAESLLIAAGGGLAGLGLAALSLPVLLALVGTTLPRADTISIDARVVAFTLCVAASTGLIAGLFPALQLTRLDVRDTLNEGGRPGMGGGPWQRRVRGALVVAEIALTVTLTIGAALLIRSFSRLQDVSAGFDAHSTLAAELPLSSVKYGSDATRTTTVDRLLERIAAVPGVRSAAVTTFLPMSGGGTTIHFNIKGRPPASPEHFILAGYRAVSGRYFETLGIPLRKGRLLDDHDRQGSPHVIVVNETFARQFFAHDEPLGQHIQLGALPEPDAELPYMEVVGVVGDVRQQPDADARAEMYVPYDQYPDDFMRRLYSNVNLIVKAGVPPATLATTIRSVVHEIDADQPLANVRTMDDVLAASVSQPRLRTLLLGVFAATALLLAAIGVYGLLAHGVTQRAGEFGVRLALGASPAGVQALVLRQGLTLALTGLAIGLAITAAAVRVLNSVLFEITPWDPLAWIGAAAMLLVVALLASWLPARRALRVDPVIALRG